MGDAVNHPSHYNFGKYEVIDVIAALGMARPFCIGNAIKYIARAGHKNDAVEDLKKARFYISWLIDYEERTSRNKSPKSARRNLCEAIEGLEPDAAKKKIGTPVMFHDVILDWKLRGFKLEYAMGALFEEANNIDNEFGVRNMRNAIEMLDAEIEEREEEKRRQEPSHLFGLCARCRFKENCNRKTDKDKVVVKSANGGAVESCSYFKDRWDYERGISGSERD